MSGRRQHRAAVRMALILTIIAGAATLLGVSEQATQFDRAYANQSVATGPYQCLSERRGLTCVGQDEQGVFVGRALTEIK